MRYSIGVLLLLLSGCAFDVIHLHQVPAHFEAASGTAETWVLGADARVPLERGYATPLRRGSAWFRVGRIEQGDVYRTMDQIVTVEASNVHEAQLVLSGNLAVGFYLPVERTFTAADPPQQILRTPR
jgi:hypothetical protein